MGSGRMDGMDGVIDRTYLPTYVIHKYLFCFASCAFDCLLVLLWFLRIPVPSFLCGCVHSEGAIPWMGVYFLFGLWGWGRRRACWSLEEGVGTEKEWILYYMDKEGCNEKTNCPAWISEFSCIGICTVCVYRNH